MNVYLENIKKLLQDTNFPEAEKLLLLKQLSDADKQWAITDFKLDRTEKVKRTTAILLEETIEELEQKRRAVEAQNRELEIESSLERVRTFAMSINKPDDMLDVCKNISLQLQSLGVNDIRNVQTAIFYEEKGTYMNYEYYAKHDQSFITETTYTDHEIAKAFAAKMLKGKGEVSITLINGEEKVKEWLAHQKTTNVFIDTFLETASSLNYYWFSLGPVALGISSYVMLTDQELNLFKRFLNVFELAYRRYLDIEKAIAQVKEAQIQLALERVRARTMAMQHSDELQQAANLLFQQVQSLEIPAWSCGYNIWEKEEKICTGWMSSEGLIQPPFKIPLTENPTFIHFYKSRQRNEDFYVEEMGGEELAAHYKYMLSLPDFAAIADKHIKAGYALPTFQINHVANFMQGNLIFITGKAVPEAHDIFKRFAKVFEQTYTRFLDLQKAEAQAREAEIELALERVRARTMAMQHSDELAAASFLLDTQVRSLGIKTRGCAFNIYGENDSTEWFSSETGTMPTYKTPRENVFLRYYEGGKKGEVMLIEDFAGKACEDHYNYLSTLPVMGDALKEMIRLGGSFPARQIDHVIYFKYGYLLFITLEPIPQAHDIFKRFAKVFEQTYTRFLDLQKAEAQARESQIQLALERVRARTMAMQHSDELQDAALVLVNQVKALSVPVFGCGFNIWDNDRKAATAWMAGEDRIQPPFKTSSSEDVFVHIHEAAQKSEALFVREQRGEELKTHYRYMTSIPTFKAVVEKLAEAGISVPTFQIIHCAFFAQGYLMFITYEAVPEAHNIFKRFASVFEQTYTRFLDLQKAEAQAREAEIELSLERVRSKAMAMHSSADILSTTATAFEELKKLGIHSLRCGIGLLSKNSMEAQVYASTTDSNGFFQTLVGARDMNEHASLYRQYQSWLKQENLVEVMSDEELKSYYNKLFFKSSTVSAIPQSFNNKQYGYYFSFADGLFYSWSDREYTENEINILTRFKTIMALTFRRFFDLEKAEAQAKEGQIQLALERVRARTMAMQKSEELAEVATLLFKQVNELNIKTWTTGFNVWSDNDNAYEDWITNAQGGFVEPYTINATTFSVFKEVSDAKKNGKEFLLQHLEGDLLKQTYEELSKFGDKKQFEKMLEAGGQFPLQQFDHFVFGSKVSLMFITYEPVPEAHDIFKRFGKVFEQTYTRFLDLQKAEAQAKESQIEAALEKVRSRTLAMQKSDELAETAAVLFQQLIALGIEPNRLYIAIVKDEKGASEFWITDEDGTKISTAFSADMNANVSFAKMFEGWKQQRKSLVIDMQGDELQHYFQHLTSLGVPFKNGFTNKRRVQDIAYFSKGFIGIASPDEQPPETLQLLERFAAVFNLTFTRFNDLKIAEAHAIQAEQDLIAIKEAKQKAEAAFTELQATQKQLIQSEKMASLGELTAGIAHEIQNPLNFVNNFSEVSKELLIEMSEAYEKGDMAEAKELMNDIIENLEKINHHGKRADGIVKGMLQHSRSSTNQKEPTDINALADEYLRLSYHGLRAKDKKFNADFKTDFDEHVGRINIIPQDIGRVLLNLYNNAFYATNEKKKTASENLPTGQAGYKPVVSIETKKINARPDDTVGWGKVEIKVSDNGNGIPQKIIDKIFQPFFTTKPTGQGTGLGLSLSYDIIKAHGGEIKVETKEGEGTAFIIQLPAN